MLLQCIKTMKIKKATKRDIEDLYYGILQLENIDECKKFFRDLLTLSEIDAMAERFKVVQLIEKEVSYREISQKTGSSTTTITRVAHFFHHGKGGYKLVLDRIK